MGDKIVVVPEMLESEEIFCFQNIALRGQHSVISF
jgi:hypothetical protein